MNDAWGIPASLSQLPPDMPYAVIESGLMQESGMRKNSYILAANVVTINAAHIEHHKTIEEIARKKSLLLNGAANNSVAVLPRDSDFYGYFVKRAEKLPHISSTISFGEHKTADFRLIDFKPLGRSSSIKVEALGYQFDINLPLPGKHQALNTPAALATVHGLGVDYIKASYGLSRMKPGFRRGEYLKIPINDRKSFVTFIDDSWSANPVSVKAAFDSLAASPSKNRTIVCLGDMLELGNRSMDFHLSLCESIKNSGIDSVLVTGKYMKELHDSLPDDLQGGVYPSPSAIGLKLKEILKPDDRVLIKGSNGIDMWKVIAELIPWKHREKYLLQ